MFETGLLSIWFFHALTAEGLPAICIDTRHAKAALDMAANKIDANDANVIAVPLTTMALAMGGGGKGASVGKAIGGALLTTLVDRRAKGTPLAG